MGGENAMVLTIADVLQDRDLEYIYRVDKPSNMPACTITWVGSTPVSIVMDGEEYDLVAMCQERALVAWLCNEQ